MNNFLKDLSKHCNYMSSQVVEMFYNGLKQYIISGLHRNGEVTLPQLGTFRVVQYKERACRDVNTGQMRLYPDVLVVKFKPSEKMKAHFNPNFK